MELQQVIMTIILTGGNARNFAMEAISKAKLGKIKEAKELIKNAEGELHEAHTVQTKLIQNEAAGDKIVVELLMVHAQDHLMNAMTVTDLAMEFVELYEELRGADKNERN